MKYYSIHQLMRKQEIKLIKVNFVQVYKGEKEQLEIFKTLVQVKT